MVLKLARKSGPFAPVNLAPAVPDDGREGGKRFAYVYIYPLQTSGRVFTTGEANKNGELNASLC